MDLPLSPLSRTRRSVSLRPTMPAAPMIKTFTAVLPSKTSDLRLPICRPLQPEAAIDQMDVPRGEARFVRRQIDRQHSDFLRRAEPAHGLTIDEAAAHRRERLLGRFGERGDALVERGRLDRARAPAPRGR